MRISACTATLKPQSNYPRKEPSHYGDRPSNVQCRPGDNGRGADRPSARTVRRRARGGQEGIRERVHEFDGAGVADAAAASGERRPGRQPSGKGLGVDDHHPARAGRSRATRAFLRLLDGNLAGADDVGSVHDMRFVFLDNDTKMLFATAYDGDWDTYIDDFATKIPDYLDIINSAWEGWPGIRSPEAKDYLAKHQVTAEGWYVANDLTVAETRRLRRIGEAVDEFLDKVGD